MTYTCPDGHSSESGDYCDVCGLPIGGAGAAAGAGPTSSPPAANPSASYPSAPYSSAPYSSAPYPGGSYAPGSSPATAYPPSTPASANPLDLSAPAPAAELVCPNCSASNLPGALYCENCGYDFTTGQLPRPLDPPAGAPPVPTSPLPADLVPPQDAFRSALVPPVDASPSAGDSAAAPADAGSPDAAPADARSASGTPADASPTADGLLDAGPSHDAAAEVGPGAGTGTPPPLPDAPPFLPPPFLPDAPPSLPNGDAPLGTVPPVTPTSAPGHVEWVAEVWVDPDWYASQDVSEPCPSAGMPLVIPILERTVLVGRLSTSRNIHPQIDLSSDNGVSRRHAQLNSDGQRWWVEDLQSANGTFVGSAGSPLPNLPIPVGQRVELADDDRIFVGAWTRLVVRRATPEESTLGS